MSNKISKSDLGPEYEQRVKDSMAQEKPKCMHFAVGERVIYKNISHVVENYHGNWVNIRADDGTLRCLRRPYFMRHL